MKADTRESDQTARIPWLAITLALLIAGYPLSMGPLWWLVTEGYISDETGDRIGRSFYAPIGWLVESSDICMDIFVWYLSLFAPIG